MTKRDLFAEMMQGIEDMAAEREGKIILRQITVEVKPVSEATANENGVLRGQQ